MFKKADIVLAILLTILCGGSTLLAAHSGTDGTQVSVSVGGQRYGTYSLLEDQDVTIKKNGHTNVISIHGGQVSMVESDCANQLCVGQGSIRRSNQTIVCLPNQVIVEVRGTAPGGTDGADVISY